MDVNTTVYCFLVFTHVSKYFVRRIKITNAYKNKWFGWRNIAENSRMNWASLFCIPSPPSLVNTETKYIKIQTFCSTLPKWVRNSTISFNSFVFFPTQRIPMKASLKSKKINYSVVLTWLLYHLLSVAKHVESSTSSIFIFGAVPRIVFSSLISTYIKKKACHSLWA